jgi:hypothetical protein
MQNESHIQGSQNVVIQGANNISIVVKLGDEVREIKADIEELKQSRFSQKN